MKAAVYYSNQDVRVEEVETPSAGPGELLVKTNTCGVCVADTMEWYNKPKAPVILGHEAVGTVVECGDGVENFEKGDRVFVHHHVACMTCDNCRRGKYTLCRQFKNTRYRPGGFSEYFVAGAEHVKTDVLKLPEEMDFDEASLIEPLACVVHAAKRMEIQPEDRVAVIGTGTMGLMLIETLKAYGVSDIVAYEMIPWRQKQVEKRGVPVRVALPDINEEQKELQRQMGYSGFDKVCVMAKDVKAMEMGLNLAGPGSIVLLFATPAPEEYLKFYASEAFFKEMTIKLSYSADHKDTREAMRLIRSGQVDAKSFVTHRFGLGELSKAIQQTAGRGESLKCVVKVEED